MSAGSSSSIWCLIKHWTALLFALTASDLNLRWLSLAGISGDHLCDLPAQAPTASCSAPWPEGSWLSRGWWFHKLPGQPVPVVVHSHSEKAFPDVQMKSSRCAELGQSYSQRGQATQTKHSYMGCLNIHLPEHLPVNHCPADTLLEVEELGKERPG